MYNNFIPDIIRKKEDITAYLAGIQQGFINIGIEAISVIEHGAVVETIISVAQRGKCGHDCYRQPWQEWVIQGILWQRDSRCLAQNRSTHTGHPVPKHIIFHLVR